MNTKSRALLKRARYLAHAAGYVVETKLLRRHIPFIGGLVINEKCNLQCRQCSVANRKIPDLTYEEIRTGLENFYDSGIRSVFIEGGEPFLWSDGDRKLEEVVAMARHMGFHIISLYTNGTFPIETTADTVFVSLDGLRVTNDALRGRSFDAVMRNIEISAHPNIIINFTINRLNEGEIEEFCRMASGVERIRGVFFYFHTPYYGLDDLFLGIDEKREIVGRLLALKKKGFRIFNSNACLKSVARDDWRRPSDICHVFAANEMYVCCRARGNETACRNCGYLGYPEIIHILALKPSSIASAFNYLPRAS